MSATQSQVLVSAPVLGAADAAAFEAAASNLLSSSAFASALATIDAAINGSAAMVAALTAHVDGEGHLPPTLIDDAALLVAARYECVAERGEHGWRFLSAVDNKRHAGATQWWRRNMRDYDATPKSARGGDRTKSEETGEVTVEAGRPTPTEEAVAWILRTFSPEQQGTIVAALTAARDAREAQTLIDIDAALEASMGLLVALPTE